MHLICTRCETVYSPDPRRFRCERSERSECGAVLRVEGAPAFDPAQIDHADHSLWRYRHALPLPAAERAAPVTLGEGMTPLVPAQWGNLPIHLKCEFLNPTGSFKDRGAAVLVTALAAAGVQQVVEDSSGNAGSSLAAYAARAGIRAAIYVPAHASPIKQAQIAAYGAQVVPVPGSRTDTANAVRAAVGPNVAYASHVYHPLIPHGTKTIAFELWEQLGQAPDAVVLPLGHGTQLLGLAQGFGELRAAGCLDRLPRLYGVQAAPCAPLALAWAQGATDVAPVPEGDTVAEGVRIAAPVRGAAILAAVRESGGAILAVPDDETLAAQRRLAHQGFYVEPTSALAVAALDRLQAQLAGAMVVVVLTGSGFKSQAHPGPPPNFPSTRPGPRG